MDIKPINQSQSIGTTYIIGHKNPDADSICSAIAYANLKQLQGHQNCIAARCGNTNARIDAILSRFNQTVPLFIGDVTPRIKDIMVQDVVTIDQSTTCAEALELIDAHDIRALPVINEEEQLIGYISVFQLGDYFIPKVKAPREMRHVKTTINAVIRALKANVLNLHEGEDLEDLYVKVGAMDIRSFSKFSEGGEIPATQSIIVVGDRWDIQQRSIQTGVRLLVITGNLPVDQEVIEQAKEKNVSIIVSPYDSATTAWIIRTASTVERMIERDCMTFGADEKRNDVRKKIATNNMPAYMVVDENQRLLGIFSKTNILQPIQTKLILVDHNEMSQAVPGAHQVKIEEIIDHHRLGALNTQQPILFINEPVGSTCTIVADLYRRYNFTPTPDIAGTMMGGIIADTLNLNSPTSTPKDEKILRWLEEIAMVKADELAHTIFSSGSVILSHSPDAVIRSDFKTYHESDTHFSVSQVEELGFGNFWDNAHDLTKALDKLRASENLYFSALLITDINSQNSLLIVKGDKTFIEHIPYRSVQKGEIFELPGIVSRKKQLIPFITSVLTTMSTEGILISD